MNDPTATQNPPQPPLPQPSPPAPESVSQDAIDAAIAQVEKTGHTDGLSPHVLQAACRQIEAQARAKGIDLGPPAPAEATSAEAPSADGAASNYVEAAVLDKKSTIDSFHQQRDSLKDAVAQQLKATQAPYREALQKAHGEGANESAAVDQESLIKLATALQDMDPKTIALLNVMAMISAHPEILNTVVWLEIIDTMRNLTGAGNKTKINFK